MPEATPRRVPVTVVTGFLGVGKTTAIRTLMAHRAPGERWAVVVNEYGEVGIDGAVLGDDALIREIPGGCICCTAGPQLQVALVRLLREAAPDRVLIEPTGLAHPASVLDTVARPGLREALAVRATITLVDPRHVGRPRYTTHDTWRDQVRLADVLVVNKCDLADADDVARFHAFAAELFPPKQVVATTSRAVLDPAWLELDPHPRDVSRLTHVHAPAASWSDGRIAPARAPHDAGDVASQGWIFPYDLVFDRLLLEEALQELVQPCEALPAGVLRLKGVFRTPRAWLLVNAEPERIAWEAISYRRDSRVEVIVPLAPAPRWDLVEAALLAATSTPR